jgi:hypothetical protein
MEGIAPKAVMLSLDWNIHSNYSEGSIMASATNEATLARPKTKLPMAGLLALFTAGFLGIINETIPAGLLPEIGFRNSAVASEPQLCGPEAAVMLPVHTRCSVRPGPPPPYSGCCQAGTHSAHT